MLRPHHRLVTCVLWLCAAAGGQPAHSQEWSAPVRGSWLRDGEPRPGDVVLAEPGSRAGSSSATTHTPQ